MANLSSNAVNKKYLTQASNGEANSIAVDKAKFMTSIYS